MLISHISGILHFFYIVSIYKTNRDLSRIGWKTVLIFCDVYEITTLVIMSLFTTLHSRDEAHSIV